MSAGRLEKARREDWQLGYDDGPMIWVSASDEVVHSKANDRTGHPYFSASDEATN